MAQTVLFEGAQGNRLVADLRGVSGQVVILLHGGGQTRYSWKGSAQKLADCGLRAFTMDLRGHGESDWLENGHYRFSDYGADAAAVFQQIAVRYGQKPIAVGASLGGISSLLAEGEAPLSLLAGLVLVDITPRMDPGGVNKILSFMGDKIHDGFASIEEAAEAVARYLPHRSKPKSLDGLRKNLRQGEDGRYRWHWDPRFLDGPYSVHSDHEESERRLLSATRNLRVPVQLVRGGQSELVSKAHVDEFMQMVPHALYYDVSEAGHMVAGDKNDIFCDAVLSFLAHIEVV
ncbi:MAG: alpha/beta hydrolase [Cohaesibacter sp.]|nr:alpha/beta hydrolase [Cohaesibacter sp.]